MSEEENFPVTTPKTADKAVDQTEEAQIAGAHDIVQKQLREITRPIVKNDAKSGTGFFFWKKKDKVQEKKLGAPINTQKSAPVIHVAPISARPISVGNRVVIIGAGLSGLASAALLSKKGYHVTVLEKNKRFGGAIDTMEEKGYVFEKNVSHCTMQDVFENFFKLLGEDMKDHVTIKKGISSYKVITHDNISYEIYPDLGENALLFDKLETGGGDKLRKYIEECKKMYDIARESYLYRNFDSKLDIAFEMQKLKLFSKAGAVIDGLFKNEILRGILKYQFLAYGTNPAEIPGVYSFANYTDLIEGVANIEGGPTKILDAIKKITEKHNVQYFSDAPVKRIIVNAGVVQGVELQSGRTIEADIVISNADLHHTETMLLPKENQTYPESYWSGKTIGPSMFVLHVGLKEKVNSFTERTIIFPKDFSGSLKEIFSMKQFPEHPLIYISCPAKVTPDAAPEGKETLSILVPIPAGISYGDADVPLYAEKVMHLVEIAAGISNIKEKTEYMTTYCIRDYMRDYNNYKGTASGLANTFSQTGPFRPSNMSKKVKNLYYVGSNTHPGTSMPLCLISAELVYKRIEGIKTNTALESL